MIPSSLRELKDVKLKRCQEILLISLKYVDSNNQEREKKLLAVQSSSQAVANMYLWGCTSYN